MQSITSKTMILDGLDKFIIGHYFIKLKLERRP